MALVGVNGQTQIFDHYYAISTTLTPAFSFSALVHVIGAGGSGAASDGAASGGSPAICMATGGGAGGHAISRLNFTSGVTYTITIGAGGAQHQVVDGQRNDGNAGGNSSISGSDITTMTANGGGAGQGSIHESMSSFSESGGTGGSASGGNIANLTGGAGGAISGSAGASNATAFLGTGGGAVNVGRGAFAGGAINLYAQHAGTMRASGGGGTGGQGAYLNASSATSTDMYGMGGAGTGPAADATSGNAAIDQVGYFLNYTAANSSAADQVNMAFGQNIFSSLIGGTGYSGQASLNGGGGGGTNSYGGSGGFGGTAGVAKPLYSGRSAGQGEMGSGSGGLVSNDGVAGNYVYRGGNGMVLIRVLEV